MLMICPMSLGPYSLKAKCITAPSLFCPLIQTPEKLEVFALTLGSVNKTSSDISGNLKF